MKIPDKKDLHELIRAVATAHRSTVSSTISGGNYKSRTVDDRAVPVRSPAKPSTEVPFDILKQLGAFHRMCTGDDSDD